MAKLKLNPEPTFKAEVKIPVPGGEADPVEFTFKHRDRAAMREWIESTKDKTDAEVVGSCIVGWALDDEFTPENIQRLCDNYIGAGGAIFGVYLEELRGARTKN